MWQAIFSFFSGYAGKAFLLGGIALCFYVQHLHKENLQAKLEKSEQENHALQQVNHDQKQTINFLQQEQQKQEKILLQFEQERQALQDRLRQKERTLQTLQDPQSQTWKTQKLPEQIKELLK